MDFDQAVVKNLIEKRFSELKSRNPRFSLRAFARKLSISPSALSEILNNKRKVSSKMGMEIVNKLSDIDSTANFHSVIISSKKEENLQKIIQLNLKRLQSEIEELEEHDRLPENDYKIYLYFCRKEN